VSNYPSLLSFGFNLFIFFSTLLLSNFSVLFLCFFSLCLFVLLLVLCVFLYFLVVNFHFYFWLFISNTFELFSRTIIFITSASLYVCYFSTFVFLLLSFGIRFLCLSFSSINFYPFPTPLYIYYFETKTYFFVPSFSTFSVAPGVCSIKQFSL